MKTIKALHKAVSSPIDDLVTYRALPAGSVEMETLNPFIFLNHHGPQIYKPGNHGLPFGPHPHRGMETVTFILEGDIMHKDSSGHKSIITAGGIQWMTAGRGVIHAETSSDEFMREGGPLEILQLWLNLPAKHKMDEPFYKGLQKDDIPSVVSDDGKVVVDVISGNWNGTAGAFNSVSGVSLYTLHLKTGGSLQTAIPAVENVFFYVVKGKVNVNGTSVNKLNLVEFNHNGDALDIQADEESIVLLGHAAPLNEPVAAHGPFVMNTEKEIMEAYADFRAGKFGMWKL